MSNAVQPLVDECQRQSENCSYTAASFTIWLRCLCSIRSFSTIAPIVFGALATWKLVSETSPTWAAVFIFLATVIPPAYRASRVEAAIEDYTVLAGEFTNLRDLFRHAALVTSQKGFSDLEAESKVLLDRLGKRAGECWFLPNGALNWRDGSTGRVITSTITIWLVLRRTHKRHSVGCYLNNAKVEHSANVERS